MYGTAFLVPFVTKTGVSKMKYNAGEFDIAVIGAGHAGCEAALAAARMGMKTCLLYTSGCSLFFHCTFQNIFNTYF